MEPSPTRRTQGTAFARRLSLALLLAAAAGSPVGCSAPDYLPPALPAFMHEEAAVQVPSQGPVTLCAAEQGCANACAAAVGAPVPEQPPVAVSLPEAVHECVFANLLIRAGAEKVQQARAGLLQASLIPNPTLYLDSILNPLGAGFTHLRQGGPPQDDVAVTFPIDWCLFGKRVAAIEAGRLGVDVAAADLANVVRVQVTNTVLAFYDVLEARELLRIARQDLEDAERIGAITRRLVKAGELAPIENDRAGLLAIDARREVRRREAALNVARAKLAPLLGRCSPVPEVDARGELTIAAPTLPLELCEAMRLAEQQRPDILALTRRLAQAEAEIVVARRKAYPEVNVQPLFTYQYQEAIGFPDARTWGVALTTTLPLTDRNQGNIARAYSVQREAVHNLHAELAALRSEVKQAVDVYQATLSVAMNEDPAAVEAARRVRDKTEAGFLKGQDSLLNLLLVQRAYLERLRLSVTVKADHWRALHRLNSAVGGRAVACAPPAEREELPPPRPAAEIGPPR